MQFANAVINNANQTQTENGMAALHSSLDHCVDLFFKAGASRGKNISYEFTKAIRQEKEVALRLALWMRDARGGAGEREQFRNFLRHAEINHPAELEDILHMIPLVGRWDDLLVFRTEQFQTLAFALIGQALLDSNGLCAKWMPRKGAIAVALRNFFEITPKQYRKLIVSLSDTVEQKMCAKQWDAIDFGKLPSVAASRYQKAFARNAEKAYNAYKQALVKGEAKINANAIFPYDVLRGDDKTVVQAQWDSLPNWLSDDACILPMIDVSGSMTTSVSAGLSAMDIAISLGLYIATKQTGRFANLYLTFTSTPELASVSRFANIVDAKNHVSEYNVGYDTNLERAFDAILKTAVKAKVPQSEMPKYLIVFSDMQFNASAFGYRETAQQMAKRQFEQAGYELPKLVWWNIADRGSNIPVKYDEQGNALVSGFSPSLVKSILAAKNFNPRDVMLDTVMQDRYDYTK